MKTEHQRIYQIASLGMLAAIAVLLTLFNFPLLPTADFLKFEFSDTAILIGTFVFGVPAGLALTFVASLLQSLLISFDFPWGWIMHFVATGTLVTVAGLIYRKKKGISGMIIALICGTLAMTAVMIPLNLIITPIYRGAPVEAVISLLLPAIIPFNLLKAGINSVVVFILFRSGSMLRGITGRKTGK